MIFFTSYKKCLSMGGIRDLVKFPFVRPGSVSWLAGCLHQLQLSHQLFLAGQLGWDRSGIIRPLSLALHVVVVVL